MIFDCDGVLVDSETISNRVLAEMLSDEGLPTTPAQSRREHQGMLLKDIRVSAERRLGRRLADDWIASYESERDSAFRKELRPVPGVAEAIARIEQAEMAVCVASQGKLAKIGLTLTLTGLDRFFPADARFSSYSVANGKPAPDVFLHAATSMGAEASDCVVVEDSPSGVLGAVRARMRVVGYAADSDEQALRDAGASIVLHSLDRLAEALELE